MAGNGAEPDWIEALLETGRNLDRAAFLLPTQDEVVSAVSRHRVQLAPWYRFVLPDDEVVQTFLDKTKFYNWAVARGLPMPASRVVRSKAAVDAALDEMRFPLILKPLCRTAAWNRVSPVDKAFRLEKPADLGRIPFDPLSVTEALLISEWIDGPDDAVRFCLAYCDSPGRIAASFTGRKLLQYPRLTGSTAVCVAEDNEEVRGLTEEVFRQSGFLGLGSLEVKYNAAGRPFIMEPTVGRPNLQSHSAVAAGCNLHALAMAHALGRELPLRRRSQRRCFWVEEAAVFELMTTSAKLPVPWRVLFRELVRARRLAGAYWSWWDPAPMMTYFRRKIGGGMRRLLRARAA